MSKILKTIKNCQAVLAFFVPLYVSVLCIKSGWMAVAAVVFVAWVLFWAFVIISFWIVSKVG